MICVKVLKAPGRAGRAAKQAEYGKEGKHMATSQEYVEFVCDQIREAGQVRYRKMFGEYMVYVNEKPLLLVCDNQVFVKPVEAVAEALRNAEKACPYQGAKEYFLLGIDNREKSLEVVGILEHITPQPRPKKPKAPKI